MAHIREKGVQSGAVYLPTTLADLENFAHALGYPNFDFVIKPRSGHGSRGFHVVSSNYDLYEDFTASRSYTLSLEVLKDLFSSREQALSNYFLMEMFPGDKYSADVLVSRSRIHTMVIRNNGPIPKVNPPTQNARIVFDPDVRSYARRIIDALDFDYFVQVEVGRTRDDELGLVEVNTRMDATLPITEGLGLNFFREMITYAMTGKMRADIPYYHDYPKKLCFRRYWSHLFAEMDTHE
jgi:biotin carboxylase